MKKRSYKPKRITLPGLLLRSLSIALVLSLVFAWGCWNYLIRTIRQQSRDQVTQNQSRMQNYINRTTANSAIKDPLQEISARMAMYQMYDIMIDDPIALDDSTSGIQIIPCYSSGCYELAALVDENGEIAASSREVLLTILTFEKDAPDNGIYTCSLDTGIPEVEALYKAIGAANDEKHYAEMQLTSAYVNREKRTFIPHECSMTCYQIKSIYDSVDEAIEQETKTFCIEIDDESYELLELHAGTNAPYPRRIAFNLYGTPTEDFDLYSDGFTYQGSTSSYGGGEWYRDENLDLHSFENHIPVVVDGKNYTLYLRFIVNEHEPQIIRLFWKWALLFTTAMTILALLWAWRQNVLNKAKYAFEDYQRDLTDHLAHDIKTPLMTIGGYAENILDGKLSGEEQTRYLHSILDNIAFTDSLISRTLYLNHTGNPGKVQREPVQAEALVEAAVRKYDLLLSEKQITCKIDGSASVKADRSALEAIIENLVSNAVRYTPEGGTIEALLGQKRLLITNTVTGKITTKDLKRPFVRGDEARSNVDGSGLGLSIADRAALANGFALNISCTEQVFRAELKF